MSKIKMRCNVCGKWFQASNAKELTCPECVQKARKEKAAKSTSPTVNPTVVVQGTRPAPPPPPKPKVVQSGTNQWLDSLNDVKVGQPEQQPPRPKLPPTPAPRDNREPGNGREFGGPSPYRDERSPRPYDERGPRPYDERGPRPYDSRGPRPYDERSPRPYQENRGPSGPNTYREGNRGPGGYRPGPGGYTDTPGQRPRQPMEGGFGGRGPRPGGPGESRFDRPRPSGPGGPPRGKPGMGKPKMKTPKPPPQPKPKREKTPPPPPFAPTPEQVAQVETRYLELSTPTEFDGIRTQIAQEMGIPKSAVKKIVKELRDRQNIPSWWEIQTYKGSTEELDRIRAAYEPLLPLPDIGVHKTIAEQLNLKPSAVYQAIKLIRLELNLPQYNDPALHGLPPTPPKQEKAEVAEVSEAPTTAETPVVTENAGETAQTPAAEAVEATEVTASSEAQVVTEDVPTANEPTSGEEGISSISVVQEEASA